MPDEQAQGETTSGAVVDNQSKWTFDIQRGLAWTIVLTFCVAIWALIARTIISAGIEDIVDLLKLALGVLFNIVLLIIGYWFGSSKSSQSKDDTQNKILDKLTPPAPTPPVDSGSTTTTTTIEKKD